jgi:hypothetical protein
MATTNPMIEERRIEPGGLGAEGSGATGWVSAHGVGVTVSSGSSSSLSVTERLLRLPSSTAERFWKSYPASWPRAEINPEMVPDPRWIAPRAPRAM